MKNNFASNEFIFSTIIVILLFFFINPFNILMPPPYLAMMIVLLIVLFSAFAVIVWREQARDEREGLHRMLAARFAYLAGGSFLVIAIIIQSVAHNIDPFLVYTLALMILAKIFGRIYGKIRF